MCKGDIPSLSQLNTQPGIHGRTVLYARQKPDSQATIGPLFLRRQDAIKWVYDRIMPAPEPNNEYEHMAAVKKAESALHTMNIGNQSFWMPSEEHGGIHGFHILDNNYVID